MVQWGAYGKARRGLSDSRILADYYGGLVATAYAEPATIRVGIATGLSSVEIASTGTVTAEQTNVATGPWRITGARGLRVRPGPRPPTYITAGSILGCPRRTGAGRSFRVRFRLPQLSVASVVLSDPRGASPDHVISRSVTLPEGVGTLRAKLPAATVTGSYRIRIRVTNGTDIVETAARPLRVRGVPPEPSPSPPSPSPLRRAAAPPAAAAGFPVALVVAGSVAVAAAGAGILVRAWLRARRRRPSVSP